MAVQRTTGSQLRAELVVDSLFSEQQMQAIHGNAAREAVANVVDMQSLWLLSKQNRRPARDDGKSSDSDA